MAQATSLWPTYFYNIQFNLVSAGCAAAKARCVRGGNMELNAAQSEYKRSEIVTALMRSECRFKGFCDSSSSMEKKVLINMLVERRITERCGEYKGFIL